MITLNTFDRSPRLAELKVSYKRKKTPDSKTVTDSRTAAEYFRAIWNRDMLQYVEEFYLLCLNGAHEPLGWVRVNSGGLNSTKVDPRVIFGIALQTASTAIIVAHNHPSGSLVPSAEDRTTTAKLKEAGNLLGLRLLDHIILTPESAFSFADAGEL